MERGTVLNAIDFYTIYKNGTVKLINKNYDAEYIYAGVTYTGGDIDSRDYVKLAADENTSGKEITFYTTKVNSYVVTEDTKGRYLIAEQSEDYEIGDKLIVVANKSGSVLYVINVTQSTWYNKATKQDVIYADLYVDKDNSGDYSAGDTGLYAEIWADYY